MAIALKVYVSMTAIVLLLAVTGCKSGSRAIGDQKYWEDMQARVIRKHVGQPVQIECPYPSSHDKEDQFLCKGDNPYSCERRTDKTKLLRVNERKKHFSVHISDLSKADSGTYWCRSNKTWKISEYTKVQLEVDERITSTRSRRPAVRVTAATAVMTSKPFMLSSTPSTHSVVKYTNLTVLVPLLLLAVPVLTLVVFIYKRIWKQGGSPVQGTHDGPNNQVCWLCSVFISVLHFHPSATFLVHSREIFLITCMRRYRCSPSKDMPWSALQKTWCTIPLFISSTSQATSQQRKTPTLRLKKVAQPPLAVRLFLASLQGQIYTQL
ncbi:uncharacterized protein LOC144055382 [Vanacampus margaritifer]